MEHYHVSQLSVYLLLIQGLVKIQGLREIQQKFGTYSHFRYAKMKICGYLRSTHISSA